MILMVTVCYEDGAYRVGGLPDNQTLAFDTLEALLDTLYELIDVAMLKYQETFEDGGEISE